MARKPRQSNYGRPIKVALTCNEAPQNVTVDSTFVGYGCTMEAAKGDFFGKVMAQAAQQLRCGQGGCEETRVCVAEILDTAAVELRLTCNRVQLPGCQPGGVGWKCYLHEAGTSSQIRCRCTCAPRVI